MNHGGGVLISKSLRYKPKGTVWFVEMSSSEDFDRFRSDSNYASVEIAEIDFKPLEIVDENLIPENEERMSATDSQTEMKQKTNILREIGPIHSSGLISPTKSDLDLSDCTLSPSIATISYSSFPDDSLESIRQQSEAGIYSLKRIKSFSFRLAKIQEAYSQEIQKLVLHERKKISSMKDRFPGGDQMENSWNGYVNFVERASDLSLVHGQLAATLNRSASRTLEEGFEKLLSRFKDIIVKEKTSCDSVFSIKQNLEKAKLKALKAIVASGLVEDSCGQVSGGTGKQILSMFSSAANNNSKKDSKLADVCYEAVMAYKLALDHANEYMKTVRRSEIDEILKEFQSMEEYRMQLIKEHLNDHGLVLEPLSQIYHRVSEQLSLFSARIDINSELKSFANKLGYARADEDSSNGDYFDYELPVSLKAIEFRRFNSLNQNSNMKPLKRKEFSWFGISLVEVMSAQRYQFPELKIPRIFETILQALNRENAYEVEGLFRVNCDFNLLNRTVDLLNRGNFILADNSAHVHANVLKKWLRELKDPLIPLNMYPLDREFEDSDDKLKMYLSFMSALPETNRLILLDLLKFLRLLIQHEKKSMMSAENVSVCLTPNVLRHPNKKDLNMSEMQKFGQLERSFFEALLTVDMESKHCYNT